MKKQSNPPPPPKSKRPPPPPAPPPVTVLKTRFEVRCERFDRSILEAEYPVPKSLICT